MSKLSLPPVFVSLLNGWRIWVPLGVLALSAANYGPGYAMGFAFTALVIVSVDRIERFTLGGQLAKVEATLHRATEQAASAKELSEKADRLAKFTVEMITALGSVPRGMMGGGSPYELDELRKVIVENSLNLELSRTDVARYARYDDPESARRLFLLLQQRVAHHDSIEAAALMKLFGDRGDQIVGPPDKIRPLISDKTFADPKVSELFDLFSGWYESDQRIFFICEHLPLIRAMEHELYGP